MQRCDEETVRRLFALTAGRSYEIRGVELLRNEVHEQGCSSKLVQLDQRRGAGGVFDLDFFWDLDAADRRHKEQLLDHLRSRFRTADWAPHDEGSQRLANVVAVWHGASKEAIDGIARHGFANLGRTDAGWFGSGCYSTLEAELACLYASEYPEAKDPNEEGNHVAILAAAVIGLAYPVTPGRKDFPNGPLPPTDARQCRFYGRPMQSPCDTHIVAIHGMAGGMLCCEPAAATYHEVLSKEDTQLLPLAKVFFRRVP